MLTKTLIHVLLAVSILFGCSPSSSKAIKFAEADKAPQSNEGRQELISAKSELFPLSAYYGVCVRHANVLRASIHEGLIGQPTIVELTGRGGGIRISVGKIGVWPGTVLKDAPVISLPRRIQIGQDNGQDFVLVSNFGSENNTVSIVFDKSDSEAEAEVMRLANNVVACHLSAEDSGG